MDTGLRGRVAVVTAAGSGIGLSTVDALLEEGARVVGADIDTRALRERPGVLPVEADLLDDSAAGSLIETALTEHGRVDVLVNGVGGGQPMPDRLLNSSPEDWRRTFELNVFTMIKVTQAALPHMISAGGGVIVSISSDAASEPEPDFFDYSAAKAAIVNISKSIATAYGPRGIRSSVVLPSLIRTPMTEGFIAAVAQELGADRDAAEAHIAEHIKEVPLRRIGDPRDVARVIVFLASDGAAYVTGGAHRVDGGRIPTV